MMGKFTIVYQRSHDIDWFARVGHIYIHAMSFGGLLPASVNTWITNLNMLRMAYRMQITDVNVVFSDYVEGVLRENNEELRHQQDRERYLTHLRDMARRGFLSFDRDPHNEDVYHLIARPSEGILNNRYIHGMPELTDGRLEPNPSERDMRDVRDVRLVINR